MKTVKNVSILPWPLKRMTSLKIWRPKVSLKFALFTKKELHEHDFFETIFFCIIFLNVTNVKCQLIFRPEFWLNGEKILMPPINFNFSDRNFADGIRIPFKNSYRISLEFWLEKHVAGVRFKSALIWKKICMCMS